MSGYDWPRHYDPTVNLLKLAGYKICRNPDGGWAAFELLPDGTACLVDLDKLVRDPSPLRLMVKEVRYWKRQIKALRP